MAHTFGIICCKYDTLTLIIPSIVPDLPYLCIMEELKRTFCRYDMVCDNPTNAGLEMYFMPDFFQQRQGMETDRLHLHGFYEIIWFQQGSGIHYIDFNEYPIEPGTIFFISPGQIHSFDKRHDQKGVVLKICAEFLGDESSGESGYLRYNVFNAFDRLPYVKVSQKDSDRLSTIVEALGEELDEPGKLGHKDYLQSLVKMFLIRAQRNSSEVRTNILNPVRISHKTFLEFRKLLEKNYTRLHTVKDYAGLLNISTKTLNQYVRECSAYSPLEIINNRIALEAKRLLRYSTLTVKEIAFRLGFEDPSYFVKFFKRLVGESPADYREGI